VFPASLRFVDGGLVLPQRDVSGLVPCRQREFTRHAG